MGYAKPTPMKQPASEGATETPLYFPIGALARRASPALATLDAVHLVEAARPTPLREYDQIPMLSPDLAGRLNCSHPL